MFAPGGLLLGGVCYGGSASGGVCSGGGCLLLGRCGVSQHALRQTPSVDRITDMSKNITLATTSLQPVIIDQWSTARISYCLQTKFAKVMFLRVSVCPRGHMHGREGMHGGGGACVAGDVWGTCMVGAMCGRGEGVCMAGGHAWQGGMCGRGACMVGVHAWQGGMHGGRACMAGGMHAMGACVVGGGHA